LTQENHLKPKNRAIILRLPESLIDRLDSVAYDLRMPSRSHYIRRSIERALEFSEAHEVPLLDDPELQRALAR
jgi:metal-responsive CopG/Arc/MetJ family transcriptional regulator